MVFGGILSVTFRFLSFKDHEITTLTADVYATTDSGVQVPFPGFNPDACASLAAGQTCPREAGATTTYEFVAEIGVDFVTVRNLKFNILITIKECKHSLKWMRLFIKYMNII